jgi:hypothetical protein
MDSKKKTDPVTLRLTSEEKGRIVRLAAALGISVSEFCRRGIFGNSKLNGDEPNKLEAQGRGRRKRRRC